MTIFEALFLECTIITLTGIEVQVSHNRKKILFFLSSCFCHPLCFLLSSLFYHPLFSLVLVFCHPLVLCDSVIHQPFVLSSQFSISHSVFCPHPLGILFSVILSVFYHSLCILPSSILCYPLLSAALFPFSVIIPIVMKLL